MWTESLMDFFLVKVKKVKKTNKYEPCQVLNQLKKASSFYALPFLLQKIIWMAVIRM